MNLDELNDAVRSGRITFKFELNPEFIANILENHSKPTQDRGVQRRLYKNVMTRKYKDDPDVEDIEEAVKTSMEQWDVEHPKPKRVQPAPRVGPLSEEEKERRAAERKAKKEWLDAKRIELGGMEATLGDMEKAEKEYDKMRRSEKKKILGTSLDGISEEGDSEEDVPTQPVVKRPAKKQVVKPNSDESEWD